MTQHNVTNMQDILDALERDPALQREFHKHLAEVVRNDEDLRREIRKEILTEELLQLPARFTPLEADVEQLKGDVSQLKEGQARLEADMEQVKADVEELKEGQATMQADITRMSGDITRMSGDIIRMSGQIANLSGNSYESRAIEQARRMVRRHLGMETAALLHASQIPASQFEQEVLVPAIREGRLTRRQADQLEETDCIIWCEGPDSDPVHVVVEISLTVQDSDRNRASERAAILSLISGQPAQAFVLGQEQEERGPGVPDVPFLQYAQ